MEGVGGGGCIGSVGTNSFFFSSFFFFTGAEYWDLATVTCNLYLFTDTLLYYIYGSWLHFTSLHFTWLRFWEVSSGLVSHFSSLSLIFP